MNEVVLWLCSANLETSITQLYHYDSFTIVLTYKRCISNFIYKVSLAENRPPSYIHMFAPLPKAVHSTLLCCMKDIFSPLQQGWDGMDAQQ